jgi:hypothetical protein
MIDPAQMILLLVVVVLTVLLVILGIQVFFILKELRKTLDKPNKILDDTGKITESISEPVSLLSSVLMGIKSGMLVSSFFNKKKKEDKKE